MVSGIISRVVILVFGTLYPAYSSYKAIKSRNGRDYVKWMMYWIVFALFTAVETFADVFISWIPFYYEIKILFVIWLLSPATKGSSFLYRKFVHPQLMKREKDIDEYITQVTDKGCTAILQIGTRGLNMCAATVMQTAIKGQSAVVDHLKKSYSMNDLSDPNAKYPDDSLSDDDQDQTDYYGPRKQQLGYTREKARSSKHYQQPQHDLSRVIEQEEEQEPVRRRSGRDKEPQHMLKTWLKEFLEMISRLRPDFLAVHCQEVGGKNYEESMQYVNDFIKALLASEALAGYDKSRIFLDEDFTAEDKFTALGNIYFVHESVKNVQIWDFDGSTFRTVNGREVLSGNIESVSIKEKSKFPKDFFPECRWSRKGFIRTRWLINNSLFDLVNIHLFHDASNFVAMESSPSTYAGNRWRALNYTLDRFEKDPLEKVPMFIFGDFNFRLDTQKLVQRLTDNTTMHPTHGKKNELSQLVYRDSHNNNPVLTLEKKAFDYHDKHLEIFSSYHKWLHDYDKEVLILAERLHEFEINFPPSYPYSEDPNDGISFMKTRVPSWCDRILMNQTGRDVINQSTPVQYNVIGRNVCMGDHKPVYLHCHLRQGTVRSPRVPSPKVLPRPAIVPRPVNIVSPDTQIKVHQIDNTRYIYVRKTGAPPRVFRETSV